jgi:histidyl-tRNA synthetase
MQSLPGFRDFAPKDCAARNYIFDRWREVARRYGFVEWDGPVLEPTDLYRKKSGNEIVDQLFNFIDKGEREVALRPELTPTLARVVAAREREFKKPIKWFSIGQFFRYEKQQRGRLREHYQLNCDIVGDESSGADVELIALCIDLLREVGLSADDIVVRISDRAAWDRFLPEFGIGPEQKADFLNVIDKLDREEVERIQPKLERFGVSVARLMAFLADANLEWFAPLREQLETRGLLRYCEFNLRIVRGLAYYTGIVFEVFDHARKFRAIAGGGRYDKLIHQLSDGAVDLPAVGFAMGDVVLGELLREVPAARKKMEQAIRSQHDIQIYVVIAKEERRAEALAEIQALRDQNYRVDYPLTPAKVGKQFQTAEQLGARLAVLFGDEWPQLKLKDLGTGEQSLVPREELFGRLATLLSSRA